VKHRVRFCVAPLTSGTGTANYLFRRLRAAGAVDLVAGWANRTVHASLILDQEPQPGFLKVWLFDVFGPRADDWHSSIYSSTPINQ